jgi:hypothetical protein
MFPDAQNSSQKLWENLDGLRNLIRLRESNRSPGQATCSSVPVTGVGTSDFGRHYPRFWANFQTARGAHTNLVEKTRNVALEARRELSQLQGFAQYLGDRSRGFSPWRAGKILAHLQCVIINSPVQTFHIWLSSEGVFDANRRPYFVRASAVRLGSGLEPPGNRLRY